MKLGDIVKNKKSGIYGVVKYSTFGFSIHMYVEERKGLSKTLGNSAKELSKYWEVINELPEGYQLDNGAIKKITLEEA